MLRIFGRKTSSNVQTVMWAVGELGLEHERIDVGGPFGGTDTAEFRAMNPNGLVPVIEDDGLVVFESNAITRYLAARHGAASGLWSDDPRVNAIGDMWMEWAKTTVYPVLIPGIFITLVRTPSKDRDPVRFEAQRKQLAAVMAIADGQLEKHGFLAGDALSVADFTFGTLLYRYFTLEFERADLPALRAYYDRLVARPAYREHAMIDYAFMKVE
ncbi:MAG: glutathione S-transferase family protein [Nitratireductor sp.]|nr:glutathione S-transferase family protein [Nitratireductor sp.]